MNHQLIRSMKKSALILLVLMILAPATARAQTVDVPPIGGLSQLLGISQAEVEAELAAGKTELQIALEHGMRKDVFLKQTAKAKAPVATSSKNKAKPSVVKKQPAKAKVVATKKSVSVKK